MAKIILIDDKGNEKTVTVCNVDAGSRVRDYMYECTYCKKLVLRGNECKHQPVLREAWVAFFRTHDGQLALSGVNMCPKLYKTEQEAFKRNSAIKDPSIPAPVKIAWVEKMP